MTLQATVRDSGSAGYGAGAESPSAIGDITKIWIAFDIQTFINCGTPTGITTRYAQVVDSGVAGDGIGTATTAYLNAAEDTYCVTMRVVASGSESVNQFYAAPPSGGTDMFTLYDNIGQFVTGGGWIADAGQLNGKSNFGFNARYNKSNKPQGQMVFVWRGTYWGRLRCSGSRATRSIRSASPARARRPVSRGARRFRVSAT